MFNPQRTFFMRRKRTEPIIAPERLTAILKKELFKGLELWKAHAELPLISPRTECITYIGTLAPKPVNNKILLENHAEDLCLYRWSL